ncbi:MAG: Thiamin biosynthesis lipoprotein ApbE [uncultured Thiotrichaceae bacterium]|uniref:FAD:protein FMN transferase n=1 Tax=uncultured Thiotrichaceae bacterium TaxID=298394 RepID=A0A6S6U5Q2_9GAMM|nr:MAG: Thiamin biosynthesis lipoprotein ApbE [uncultured Thiotrichaceae bacterium]
MLRFACLSLLLLLSACGQQTTIAKLSGVTMGTTWSVQIADPAFEDSKRLEEKIKERLIVINNEFSTYQSDSTISLFNQHHSTAPFKVSPEFFDVAQTANDISKLTNGAFDPTLAPLIKLWGFGKDVRTDLPDEKSIATVKSLIGYQQLILDPINQTLQKSYPELSIDYSAIAKGYAVDQISNLLLQENLQNHLVEIGGELKANGNKPANKPWTIAIAKPVPGKPMAMQRLTLNNEGIATSGNYNNFFFREGKRYSHTLDPNTARPVTHALASATVRHPSTMIADALATASMVMGTEKGIRFANEHELAMFMVNEEESTFKAYPSKKFSDE